MRQMPQTSSPASQVHEATACHCLSSTLNVIDAELEAKGDRVQVPGLKITLRVFPGCPCSPCFILFYSFAITFTRAHQTWRYTRCRGPVASGGNLRWLELPNRSPRLVP
jgi:hypothetical protein